MLYCSEVLGGRCFEMAGAAYAIKKDSVDPEVNRNRARGGRVVYPRLTVVDDLPVIAMLLAELISLIC